MMTKEEILNAAKNGKIFASLCAGISMNPLNCPGRKLKQLLVFVLSYVLWDSLPSKCKMVVF